MRAPVEKIIADLLEGINTKEDFSQILFDAEVFRDRIGLKMAGKAGLLTPDRKKAIVSGEMDRLGSDLLKTYFRELLDHDDFSLFDPVSFREFYDGLKSESEKIAYYDLTVAVAIEKKDLEEFCARLQERLGRKVLIDVVVNSQVLGGAIIKKDNFILDYSIRTKLEKLCLEWKKSVLEVEAANG